MKPKMQSPAEGGNPRPGYNGQQQHNFKGNSTRWEPFNQETTMEEIESALNALNPNLDRDPWSRVAMSLKSALDEAGFPLFDGWSRGGASYNQADCRDVWKSLKPGGGITIKTLFGMATAGGWKWAAPRKAPVPPGMIGYPTDRRPQTHTTQAKPEYNPKAWELMQKVAEGVVPLDHPTAEPTRIYLRNRGLGGILADLPDQLAIGFHPRLAYWERDKLLGYCPAIVARIQNLAGNTVTLHRTYLTADGYKADVLEPKKIMSPTFRGATQGAAIRLYSATDTLSIAEGLETCLAVRLGTGQPVWSATTARGMEALQLPIEIRTANIWCDMDRSGAGQRAAESLAHRLVREGRTVRVMTPPGAIPDRAKSLDWLDVFNTERGLS